MLNSLFHYIYLLSIAPAFVLELEECFFFFFHEIEWLCGMACCQGNDKSKIWAIIRCRLGAMFCIRQHDPEDGGSSAQSSLVFKMTLGLIETT